MNAAHADMDDTGDWAEGHPLTVREHIRLEAERRAELTADYTPAERHEGVLYTAPQGRVEQGWPVRRCSPEMACWAPDDDQTDSADAEVFGWLLKALAVVLLALFSAWCLANYLAATYV